MSVFQSLKSDLSSLRFSYIFFQNLTNWIIALVIFILFTFVIESFNISQYILSGGISSVLEILFYNCLLLLHILLPTCLFFSIVFTYNKFNIDSEIITFKSMGFSYWQISFPTWALSFLVFLLSLQSSFYLTPWAEKQIDQMKSSFLNSRPISALNIREGVFSESFSNLMIYVNKLDKANNKLERVFIYDERSTPMTIVAKRGSFSSGNNPSGFLALYDGSIYQTNDKGIHLKMNFKVNKFIFPKFSRDGTEATDPDKMNINKLISSRIATLDKNLFRDLSIEIHRRISLPFAGLVLTLIALSIGMFAQNRRSNNNLFIAGGWFVSYWLLFSVFNKFAISTGWAFFFWIPNLLFLGVGVYKFKRRMRS